jgi:hypothetical protein
MVNTVLWLVLAQAAANRLVGRSYVDPGLGSQLIQFLIAGGVGLAFIIKLQWHRIRAIAQRLFRRSPDLHE